MASIMNTANYGIARGNVSHIKCFDNRDGSKKFMVTVAAKNAYIGQDGQAGNQYVRMEGFVPKNAKLGVYAFLEVGDSVEINYSIFNDDYDMGNGKWHYGLVLRIQGVEMLESKEAKEYRKLKKSSGTKQTAMKSSIEGDDAIEKSCANETGVSAFMDDTGYENEETLFE